MIQGALFSGFGIPSFVVTLAGLLAWQGALLYVLGDTGTVNLTDPKITGLANIFYSDSVGWMFAIGATALYAAISLWGYRGRVKAGLADQALVPVLVRIAVVGAASVAVISILNKDRGLPLAVLILVGFVAGMQFVLSRTRFGRHVFAVGGNAEAARRAGIRVNGIRIAVFGIAGTMAAIGGMHGRVAAPRGEPELRRERPAAARDRGSGHRRHEPLRRARLGLVGVARRPRDRVDIERHGPARLRVVGQVHGHRWRAARRGDRRRARTQVAPGPGTRLSPAEGIRTAVVGYGLAGSVFHAPLIAATTGLEVAAVVTSDAGRAEQARADHPGVEVLAAADEIWPRAGDFDLVVVAAPNSAHVPLAEAAIGAGLAVVVDKPFAPTAAEGERLVEQARTAGVPLTVFHNRRWDDDFLAVRDVLDAGEIGAVVRIESRFDRWKPALESDRWRERAGGTEAGGLLFDLGSHLIDQALLLCGEPGSGYSELDLRRDGAVVDDDSFLALGFGRGPRVHLWMSAVAASPAPRFRIAGMRGAIEIDGVDPQEAALRSGLRPDSDGWAEALAGREARITIATGDELETRTRPIGPGRYADFYAGVRAMVADGGPPPVAPEDGVAVLQVIERARAAAAGSSPG